MEDINKKDYETGMLVREVKCLRCGHEWIPRKSSELPLSCSKCHSI